MSSPLDGWAVRNAVRYERYTRWSCHALTILLHALPVGADLFFYTLPSNPPDAWSALTGLVLLLLAAAHAVCVVRASNWSFERLLGRPRPLRRGRLAVWGAVFVALILWQLLARPDGHPGAAVFLLLVLVPGVLLLSARRTLHLCLALTAVDLVLALLLDVRFFLQAFSTWSTLWTAWSLAWALRVLRELQRAGEARRELALAEERLRISRDLHDVFGRTLAAISVKSELAAQLARRGLGGRAAAEMAAVRRLAEDAGTEVRRVVRGELRSSWPDELEGASALLASAGIRCTVQGEAALAARAEDFARVLREAVTNVLRHSAAEEVRIASGTEGGELVLVVENDGVSGPADPHGTGLAAMSERLRQEGGRLEVRREGGRFRLEARLPAPADGAERNGRDAVHVAHRGDAGPAAHAAPAAHAGQTERENA